MSGASATPGVARFKSRWVTLTLAGGVDRFVAERCRDLRAQGLFPLVLRPVEAGDASRCELWTDALQVPNLRYGIPAELAALSALLGTVGIDAIEIQHWCIFDTRLHRRGARTADSFMTCSFMTTPGPVRESR